MNWRKRRAQTSMEFLVLAGFMLFVFTAFIFVVQQRSATASQQVQSNELESAAQTLNQEVLQAYEVQNGYSRTFELPSTLNGEQYTMSLTGTSEITFHTTGHQDFVLFLPANVTFKDAGGVPVSQLSPGRITITKDEGNISIKAIVQEIDTCSFSNGGGQTISCFPSSGGSCTAPGPSTTCNVGVTGTNGQTITWTSTCGGTATSTFDQVNKQIDIACVNVTETYTCHFTGTSLQQSCWSNMDSCAGLGSCTVHGTGLTSQSITWTSSCSGFQTTVLDTDASNNDITFDCSHLVQEQVICLFLGNPVSGILHSCTSADHPTVTCSTIGDRCTIATMQPPGTAMGWTSDCRGGADTVITNETKDVPFFCSTDP